MESSAADLPLQDAAGTGGDTAAGAGHARSLGSAPGAAAPPGAASSCTLEEALPMVETILRQTHAELSALWREVGYSQEDRDRQIGAIVTGVRMVCADKLGEQHELRGHFVEGVKEVQEEIFDLVARLHEELDVGRMDRCGAKSLTENLAGLEGYAEELRGRRDAQSARLADIQQDCVGILSLLGDESLPAELEDVQSDLTDSRIAYFGKLREGYQQRLEARKEAVARLVLDCQRILEKLKEGQRSPLERQVMSSLLPRPPDDADSNGSGGNEGEAPVLRDTVASETSVGISGEYVSQLRGLLERLEREQSERQERLKSMGEDIGLLWERLGVSAEAQEAFTASVDGLGLDTIRKGEEELSRLQGLQRAALPRLIAERKGRLERLWGQLGVPQSDWGRSVLEDEREPPLERCLREGAEASVEVLLRLEAECDALGERVAAVRPLLQKIEARETLLKERMELEELKKDPSRLQGKGSYQQRAKEEKMQVRITRKLPQLTDQLVRQLKAWEEEHGEPFTFAGRSYLEAIKESEEDWKRFRATQAESRQRKKREDRESMYRPLGTFGAAEDDDGGRGAPARSRSISQPQLRRAASASRAQGVHVSSAHGGGR